MRTKTGKGQARADAQLLASTTTSVPEAGRLLSLSRNAAYAAAKRGEIPTLKLGKRLVVPTAALRSMLGLSPLAQDAGEAA